MEKLCKYSSLFIGDLNEQVTVQTFLNGWIVTDKDQNVIFSVLHRNFIIPLCVIIQCAGSGLCNKLFCVQSPDPECLFSFHAGMIQGLDVSKKSYLMATTTLDCESMCAYIPVHMLSFSIDSVLVANQLLAVPYISQKKAVTLKLSPHPKAIGPEFGTTFMSVDMRKITKITYACSHIYSIYYIYYICENTYKLCKSCYFVHVIQALSKFLTSWENEN